jgi:hypothetical protein
MHVRRPIAVSGRVAWLAAVVLTAALLPLAAAPVRAQPIPLEQIAIPYGPEAVQQVTLIRPVDSAPAPRPTLVLAHGGLWQQGNASALFATCEAIVQASGGALACASAGYRLSLDLGGACAPEAGRPDTYPDQARALAAAMARLQIDGPALGLDPHRFFVGGHSAGGHLAQLLNLRFDTFAAECPPGAACPPPVGAGGLEGIYDVRVWDAHNTSYWGGAFFCATRRAFGTGPMFEGPCYDASYPDEFCWDVGSPRYLAANAARFGATPSGDVLLIHSPGDLAVDIAEATLFGSALQSAFPALDVRVAVDGSCGTLDHGDVLLEQALIDCVSDFVLEKSATAVVPLAPWVSLGALGVALGASGVWRRRGPAPPLSRGAAASDRVRRRNR